MRKMVVISAGLCFLALAVCHAFAGSGESNIRPVDWNSMMPTVRSVLEKEFPREAEKQYPVGIRRSGHVADITGDGIAEALVLLGTGGASTSELVLMRIENNKPVVALIKDRQGDGEAYRWDSQTETFDYDSRLSRRLAQNSCSKVPQSVN